MTDDPQTTQQPPKDITATTDSIPDPIESLDELLAKAKAKRNLGAETTAADAASPVTAPVVAGPTQEEIQEQKMAELAERERVAAAEQAQMLAEQKKKMAELKETPQFQAQQQQNLNDQEKSEEQHLAQQGHVIHQVGETKV